MSVFENFSALDGLAQVIYQDAHRFVLVSKVHSVDKNAKARRGKHLEDASKSGWEVHIGLTDEGRWWCGWWREADVKALTGSKPSATLLATFATNLAQTIIKGELFVSNVKEIVGSGASSSKDVSLKLVLGPTGSKPLTVLLDELSANDVGIFAAREFFDIAMSAQSRGCRLSPVHNVQSSAGPSKSNRASSVVSSSQEDKIASASTSKTTSPPRKKRKGKETSADVESEEVRRLRAELAVAKKQTAEARAEAERLAAERPPSEDDKPVMLRIGNPYKKVRRIQTMEFVSDEE